VTNSVHIIRCAPSLIGQLPFDSITDLLPSLHLSTYFQPFQPLPCVTAHSFLLALSFLFNVAGPSGNDPTARNTCITYFAKYPTDVGLSCPCQVLPLSAVRPLSNPVSCSTPWMTTLSTPTTHYVDMIAMIFRAHVGVVAHSPQHGTSRIWRNLVYVEIGSKTYPRDYRDLGGEPAD
jgi:hypothetical protein